MAATETIKKLRARVTDLEAEVVRLKKELAVRGRNDAAPIGAGAGQREGHGPLCACIGCRAGRG